MALKPFKTNRKKKRVKPSANAVATVAEVKKMIDRKVDDIIEDKIFNNNFALLPVQTTSDVAGHVVMDQRNQFCITPGAQNVIPQAVGQGGKTGNRIKIKKAVLKFALRANPFLAGASNNADPQPQFVRCLLLYDRIDPALSTAPPFGVDFASAVTFQNGSTSSPFNGTLWDLTRYINSDQYAVLWDRTYKIGNQYYITPGDVNAQQYGNNDFQFSRLDEIDYTNYIVKHVRWNDNVTPVTTRGLYFYCYSVNASGKPIGLATPPSQIGLDASIQIIYEDA